VEITFLLEFDILHSVISSLKNGRDNPFAPMKENGVIGSDADLIFAAHDEIIIYGGNALLNINCHAFRLPFVVRFDYGHSVILSIVGSFWVGGSSWSVFLGFFILSL